MGIVDQAIADIKSITTDADGFAVPMTLTAPTGETAEINGLHTDISLAVDTEGAPVNSQQLHISFSEGALDGLGYPLRNANGVVKLSGHKVTVANSTGTDHTYVISQWMPDETTGLILCYCSIYTS